MKYRLAEHNIAISDRQYTIRSVTNFDELYDSLISRGLQHEDIADDQIPYWAELWPSAVGLATHIILHRSMIEGKTVLEIGGGLGLPALAAASVGGIVTSTDLLQDAVDFAAGNAALNHISNIKFQALDWRSPGADRYEVLLASDVAYERGQFEHLIRAFAQLVSSYGLILLSEPNRYIAEPFLKQLTHFGYVLEKFSYEVEVKDIKSKVSVYEIRKGSI